MNFTFNPLQKQQKTFRKFFSFSPVAHALRNKRKPELGTLNGNSSSLPLPRLWNSSNIYFSGYDEHG
jgi:hypothetical protein